MTILTSVKIMDGHIKTPGHGNKPNLEGYILATSLLVWLEKNTRTLFKQKNIEIEYDIKPSYV